MDNALAQSIEFGKAHVITEMRAANRDMSGVYWYITVQSNADKREFAIIGLMLDNLTVDKAFPKTSIIMEGIEYLMTNEGNNVVITNMISEDLMIGVCEKKHFSILHEIALNVAAANQRKMQA